MGYSMYACLYWDGYCEHEECGIYPWGPEEPTIEEYCGSFGHVEHEGLGFCYCGEVSYE